MEELHLTAEEYQEIYELIAGLHIFDRTEKQARIAIKIGRYLAETGQWKRSTETSR